MKLSMCGQGPSGEVDELFVVMQRAYREDPESKFIHTIHTSPDAAVVLAEDYQIKDVERFCTALPVQNLEYSQSIPHFPLESLM